MRDALRPRLGGDLLARIHRIEHLLLLQLCCALRMCLWHCKPMNYLHF